MVVPEKKSCLKGSGSQDLRRPNVEYAGGCGGDRGDPAAACTHARSMVQLFPNWVVRHVRRPNLKTASWLKRPVEVFIVSPKMTKLDIKEYLRKVTL